MAQEHGTFDSTKHYLKTAEKRNKEQMLMETRDRDCQGIP